MIGGLERRKKRSTKVNIKIKIGILIARNKIYLSMIKLNKFNKWRMYEI